MQASHVGVTMPAELQEVADEIARLVILSTAQSGQDPSPLRSFLTFLLMEAMAEGQWREAHLGLSDARAGLTIDTTESRPL